MCHFYYISKYIRAIILRQCVTSILLLLQSALQPLWDLACCTIVEYSQQKVFTECRCQRHVKPPTWRTSHFYYTVQYITTIIVTQSVTYRYITLCNISELLYLWNVSLLLHCALY